MSAEVSAPAVADQAPVQVGGRRWKRLRATAVVLATQLVILAAFLLFWDHMTAQNRAAAFMFG